MWCLQVLVRVVWRRNRGQWARILSPRANNKSTQWGWWYPQPIEQLQWSNTLLLSVHWRWKLWESWSGGNEDGDELKIPGSITHTMVNPSACSGGFSFGLTVPAAEALYDIKNSVGNAREASKSVLVAGKMRFFDFSNCSQHGKAQILLCILYILIPEMKYHIISQ